MLLQMQKLMLTVIKFQMSKQIQKVWIWIELSENTFLLVAIATVTVETCHVTPKLPTTITTFKGQWTPNFNILSP